MIISKDSMVASKWSYSVTMTPFLCHPFERDSEVEYRRSWPHMWFGIFVWYFGIRWLFNFLGEENTWGVNHEEMKMKDYGFRMSTVVCLLRKECIWMSFPWVWKIKEWVLLPFVLETGYFQSSRYIYYPNRDWVSKFQFVK